MHLVSMLSFDNDNRMFKFRFFIPYNYAGIMPLHPQTLPRALSRLFSVSQRNAYLQAQRASYSSTDKSAKPESEPESSESPDAKSGGRDMSSESPGAKSGGTDMIKQRDSGDAFVVHRQNFHAPIDHATSSVREFRELSIIILIVLQNIFSRAQACHGR
jgi:hypothetical protein